MEIWRLATCGHCTSSCDDDDGGGTLIHYPITMVCSFFMAGLWYRAGHYIFILFLLLSSFFPRLISAFGDWMFTILRHMVWP